MNYSLLRVSATNFDRVQGFPVCHNLLRAFSRQSGNFHIFYAQCLQGAMCFQFSNNLKFRELVYVMRLNYFLTDVYLRGHNGCWYSHYLWGPVYRPWGNEKILLCVAVHVTCLVSLQVEIRQQPSEFIINKWILLSLADLGEIFAPIAGWLFSRLCFIESIDHCFNLMPFLFPLVSWSCLTLLLVIDAHKHIHLDTHSHTDLMKTLLSTRLHRQHNIEKKVNGL